MYAIFDSVLKLAQSGKNKDEKGERVMTNKKYLIKVCMTQGGTKPQWSLVYSDERGNFFNTAKMQVFETYTDLKKWSHSIGLTLPLKKDLKARGKGASPVIEYVTGKIYVKVYNRLDEYANAKEAISFYKEGMAACDPNSSEYSRYAYIVDYLKMGYTFVDGDKAY